MQSQGSLNGEEGSRRVRVRKMALCERLDKPLLTLKIEMGDKQRNAGNL